jgi:hypothetical protein
VVALDVQPPLRLHPAKAGLEQFERYVWIANAKARHVVGDPPSGCARAGISATLPTEAASRKTTIAARPAANRRRSPAPRLIPNELEAVDIDQSLVGDLQVRNHRQGQERDLQERFGEHYAQTLGCRAQRNQRAMHLLEA